VDPLTHGLLALDCRKTAEALAAFAELPAGSAERNFLRGVTLLYARVPEAAVREFDEGVAAGRRPVECALATMLARIDTAEPGEQAERMARVLRLLPASHGAAAEKIERLVAELAV
jgi:hypothetical protein